MTESTITCERCSASVPAGANTCPNCGAPMSEAAATGFETTKLGDVFATTKLEMPPEEPLPEAIVEEPASEPEPEPAPEPAAATDPAQLEPTFVAPPPAQRAFNPSAEVETIQPKKEWYKNPLVWVIGCGVLLLCCICAALIAGASWFINSQADGYSWLVTAIAMLY